MSPPLVLTSTILSLMRMGLRKANLSESYSADMVINLTDFSGANFTQARIENVTFKGGTEFTGANFTQAHMEGVTFEGKSEFTGVDFTQAYMSGVRFIDIDLSKVKGLGTVEGLQRLILIPLIARKVLFQRHSSEVQAPDIL